MAQHDARPERDPGGFAYLSSLGLDDDDGLDAAMRSASGDFGTPWLQPAEQNEATAHPDSPTTGSSNPQAVPFAMPGDLAHAAEPPVGGIDGPSPHLDPTAGWALPDQEELIVHEPPSGAHPVARETSAYPAPAAPDDYPPPPAHEMLAEPPPGPMVHEQQSGPMVHDHQSEPMQIPDEAVHDGAGVGFPTGAHDYGQAPEPAHTDGHDYGQVPGPAHTDGHDYGQAPEPAHTDGHDYGQAPGPATMPVPVRQPPEYRAEPPDPGPEPVDPWQDEWQPEALGSRHPTLHGSGHAPGGRSSRRNVPTLTADTVLRTRAPKPGRGWRRAVYTVSGGRVNLGMSAAEIREQEMIQRARTPLRGCHRLAVISLKGGVGKTTTTAALGSVLATLRGDRVIAVDANPDRGTLAERIHAEPTSTVRALLDAGERVTRYAEVRQFAAQAPTRLEVLASDSDPGVSQAFSERDYHETIKILERFYNLILTDCGTGLLHSAMRGILGVADSLVIVSSASLDGARSASATLDWLEAHGLADVVSQAVTVISTVRPGGGAVDVDRLEDHFAHRCRSVVTIPYDPHLEAGGVLDLGELGSETRDAYYELAAEVGEGFLRAHSDTRT